MHYPILQKNILERIGYYLPILRLKIHFFSNSGKQNLVNHAWWSENLQGFIYLRMKKYIYRYISRPEKGGHSGRTSVPTSI